MYVKIDQQLKAIKQNELTSNSTAILLHIETETGTEEGYKCPSESPNYYHLRQPLSSDLYIPTDLVCGNEDFLMKMRITLLEFDNQHHITVRIISNIITKELRVITESAHDGQIPAYICTLGSSHYSLLETLFKNPPPVLIRNQDGTFKMTTLFLDINDKIYIIKCLPYNIKDKSYKIDTEKREAWEKTIFPCPTGSTNFAIIESLLKNPPSTKIVSMYQTI